MVYADYSYYRAVFRGAVSETDFDRLSRKASGYLDRVTFGRASRVANAWSGKVKDACCAVVDELYRQEAGGEVVSETVGKWSRTFAASPKTPTQRMYAAVDAYLGDTGLLYSGVDV